MWSKVNTWLDQMTNEDKDGKDKIKNTTANNNDNNANGLEYYDPLDNENQSNIFAVDDQENYNEINQSQVKREALQKYYSTIQAKNNNKNSKQPQ